VFIDRACGVPELVSVAGTPPHINAVIGFIASLPHWPSHVATGNTNSGTRPAGIRFGAHVGYPEAAFF